MSLLWPYSSEESKRVSQLVSRSSCLMVIVCSPSLRLRSLITSSTADTKSKIITFVRYPMIFPIIYACKYMLYMYRII